MSGGIVYDLYALATPRFLKKVVVGDENGCWIWNGSVNNQGYGDFRLPRGFSHILAHRFAYEALVGPIPEGLVLDHLCRVPRCVYPKHLEPVTIGENNRRAHAARTHCRQGHALEPDNVYISGNRRSCKVCHNVRQERYFARKGMYGRG